MRHTIFLLAAFISFSAAAQQDIAGKNKASEISFREALFAATHIVRTRRETVELMENPLIIAKLSRDRD